MNSRTDDPTASKETQHVRRIATAVALAALLVPGAAFAAQAETSSKKETEAAASKEKNPWQAGTFAGLSLRNIGPAVTSGRVGEIAIHPEEPSVWYVAVSSGGVWKTENAGTTFTPVFDSQSSYSIGTVTIDPSNPNVVWVGSGENNSQRSVSYGDGVYKSTDGGASWKNVGLPASRHIGKIVVHPDDSDVVWVAARGPLWGPGGDRGVYKTTDGGATWKRVLEISEHTGVSDLAIDPRDPDVIYAAAYQRRRHVWTLLNGGPESAVYKTTDGGESWHKLSNGLPGGDVGRIGLAVSPADPDVVYAIVEAAGESGGFFRSTDRGASWQKRSGYVSGSPQYYQELVADPHAVDRVYSMDVLLQVTDDGGASWRMAGEADKHVDNHALWIDPEDPDHLINGNDGGLYESFDRGATWQFFGNLPVTQFYKIAVDDDVPFYNVYGGTQDNFTMGGPARTATSHGIMNRDWFVVQGGDGFQPRVDPEDPDTVYAQSQYGNLVRFDRETGESVDIQPQPEPGEPALKWNWDAPLIVSPHHPHRLYFGAQRLFRSDDRGDSWRPVSPDLTRQIDRNTLPVMGKVWSVDAVSKNRSTSFYGNLVSLSESPLVEGLLYAGTDDGLVQVSEDGGTTWRKVDGVRGVPERAYVSRLEASRHDADTVYAAFDNHKNDDFEPYLAKSTDRGRSWTSIAGDLPDDGSVYALVEDPVRSDLLFVGTEFGVYFTPDGGSRWIELTGGMPTIAVRDLAIQEREGDLVVGTFGRGFYVLDDYTPLRQVTTETLESDLALFPVRDPWLYVEQTPIGWGARGFLGSDHYTAPNPPYGAVVTYYMVEGIPTAESERKKAEKKIEEEGGTLAYPSWDELRAEDREEAPQVLLTFRDASTGEVVRRLTGPAAPGFHRVAWDLGLPSPFPVSLQPQGGFWGGGPQSGPPVPPGTYTVSLAKVADGEVTPLEGEERFEVKMLYPEGLSADERTRLMAEREEVVELYRAVLGAGETLEEAGDRLAHVRKALLDTQGADAEMMEEARALSERLAELEMELEGDRTISSRSEPTPPALGDRIGRAIWGYWSATQAPTATHRRGFEIAAESFGDWLARLRSLVEDDLGGLEQRLEELQAPHTPGRIPVWQPPG